MEVIFPLKNRTLLLDFQGHIDQGRGGANDYQADSADLYSPPDGEVYVFNEAKGGKWIGIKDADGMRWEMAHLSERYVKTGDKVKSGQKIGKTGNTGTVTSGPHLHLQTLSLIGERVDPWRLLANAPFPDTMNYDNTIIRNQDTGQFAYVKGGTGKKQIITEAKAGLANITFLDRSRADKPISEQINTVPKSVWDSFTEVPNGTWF